MGNSRISSNHHFGVLESLKSRIFGEFLDAKSQKSYAELKWRFLRISIPVFRGLKLPNFREFKILNFWGYLLPEFGEFITQLRNLKNFNSPNVIKAFIPISGDLNPPIQGHFQVLIINQI